MAENIYNLKVKEVIRETEDAITIVFNHPTNGKLGYQSGQFLTLIVEVNGKKERRAYSLCTSPYTDDDMAVTAKRVDKGLVSNHLNDNVKAGDEIEILEPMGRFVLEPDSGNQRHVVLIGGGSGITPLMSILKTTLSQESSSMVSLIYSNKNSGSVIFKSKLEELDSQYGGRLRIAYHYDDDHKGVKKSGLFGKKKEDPGYLNKDRLSSIISELNINSSDNAEYFLCGPTGLMDVAEKTLTSLGMNKASIYKESFVSAKNPAFKAEEAAAATGGDGEKVVTVILYGDEHKIPVKDGNAILETGLAKGIDLPFSCQSALCTACMGKCLQGKVNIDGQQALTEDQVAEGYVLTCIGKPETDDVIIEIE